MQNMCSKVKLIGVVLVFWFLATAIGGKVEVLLGGTTGWFAGMAIAIIIAIIGAFIILKLPL